MAVRIALPREILGMHNLACKKPVVHLDASNLARGHLRSTFLWSFDTVDFHRGTADLVVKPIRRGQAALLCNLSQRAL